MDNDEIEQLYSELEVEAMEKELLKTASAPVDLKAKREKELGLLNAYKKNPSPETFQPLYQSFKPLIHKATQRNMYGSPIPQAAHTMYAAQSFLDATRTFDAAKGGFNTHVFNTVADKGKRLNLKYQNIGYIPESRATKYGAYQTSLHILKEELGREPSTLELSDELGVSPKEVERLRSEIRTDRLMNESVSTIGPSFAQTNKALQVINDIQYSLRPEPRLVLEYIYGLNGRPELVKKNKAGDKPDLAAISKATGMSLQKIRSALKSITRKLREHRSDIASQNDSLLHAMESEESSGE